METKKTSPPADPAEAVVQPPPASGLSQTEATELFVRCVAGMMYTYEKDYVPSVSIMREVTHAYYYYEDRMKPKQKDLVYKRVNHFFQAFVEKVPNFGVQRPHIPVIVHDFRLYRTNITRCGGVGFSPDFKRVLLVQDALSESWSFPRGKINEGESKVECAVREFMEETDVNISNTIDANREFKFRMNGHEVVLFPAIVPDPGAVRENREDDWEISHARWFDINETESVKTFGVEPVLKQIKSYAQRRLAGAGSELGTESIASQQYPANGAVNKMVPQKTKLVQVPQRMKLVQQKVKPGPQGVKMAQQKVRLEPQPQKQAAYAKTASSKQPLPELLHRLSRSQSPTRGLSPIPKVPAQTTNGRPLPAQMMPIHGLALGRMPQTSARVIWPNDERSQTQRQQWQALHEQLRQPLQFGPNLSMAVAAIERKAMDYEQGKGGKRVLLPFFIPCKGILQLFAD